MLAVVYLRARMEEQYCIPDARPEKALCPTAPDGRCGVRGFSAIEAPGNFRVPPSALAAATALGAFLLQPDCGSLVSEA